MRIDCHNDTALFLREAETLADLPQAQLDYARLRGVLDLAFFAIFIHEQHYAGQTSGEFRRILSLLRADLARQADIRILRWREQLAAARPGQLLALISMEGAAPLGQAGRYLAEFFDLGLRAVGLTWNFNNDYAGCALQGGGLTRAGRDLVRECNRRGLLLDAAHASSAALSDLLKWSDSPIIDSHTVCGGVSGRWPRCLTDAELRALAARGGVAGIAFVPDFLGGDGGLDQVCRHIEYAVELVGSQHVALGADYDGTVMHPDLAGVEKRPALLQRLRERGMSQADLANVEGESVRALLLRVLPSVN